MQFILQHYPCDYSYSDPADIDPSAIRRTRFED